MRDRLLSRVPERHRPLAARLFAILLIAFLAFEATRAWSVGQFVWPIYKQQYDIFIEIVSGPLLPAIVSLTAVAVAIIVQVGVLVLVWRFVRRRLSR